MVIHLTARVSLTNVLKTVKRAERLPPAREGRKKENGRWEGR